MSIAGVGLGLRAALVDDLLARPPSMLSFLEVTPENYMRRGALSAALSACRARWPVVTHGVAMSLGGGDPLDQAYLGELRAFADEVNSPWHSDHLAFGTAGGVMLHELLPIPFHEAAAVHVAERVMRAQDALKRPVAVENISYYASFAASAMDEAEFVSRVVDRAGCGLLLDVNNLYVNAHNHGFDPRAALERMPLDHVVQIHVAGHDDADAALFIDTHAAPVKDAVYELLAHALRRTGPVPVVLERDDDFSHLGSAERRDCRRCGHPRTVYAGAVMTWQGDQRWLGTALLASPGDNLTWERLGGDPARWGVYRRLMRARLLQTAEHAFAGLAEVVGPPSFANAVDAFLAHGGPRSLYLREAPGEILRFLETTPPPLSGAAAWPPCWRDLARFEWALLDVAYEPRRIAPELLTPLVMDATAAIDPAHRLLRLDYPVHRAESAAELNAMVREPVALCLHRDASTHEVATIELNEVAAVILQGVACQRRTLTDVVRDAASACGAVMDVAFITALSELLATFVERGLLLGSLVAPERPS